MDTSAADTLPHHAPPAASISIQGWVEAFRDLPPNSFAERAVDLAWMLTRGLCDIIDSNALDAQLPLEDHIRADNVIIFALPSNCNADNSATTITDARFKSLIPIEPTLIGRSAQPTAAAAPSIFPSSPPALCVALGNLLLDIFSKLSVSTGLGGEAGGSSSDLGCAHDDTDDNPPEPSGKRRAITASTVAGSSNASSDRARDILVSSGMPLSLSRLVGDLLHAAAEGGESSVRTAFSSLSLKDMLGAEKGAHSRNIAIRSVHVAMFDLSQMRAHPAQFLFDRTCPQKALDDTCLFSPDVQQLVGREEELSALGDLKDKVSNHVRETGNHYDCSVSSPDGNNFLCEAFFLCGYAGSGKSSLVNTLTRSCAEDHWFVLSCKFTQQTSSHMILAEAFNGFFGKWGAANNNPNSDHSPEMIRAFDKICTAIFNLNDGEGLRHLCDVVPNFARVFPQIDLRSSCPEDNAASLVDMVGFGRKRMRNLFHVLLKSLCSAGHPLLFTLDDLQWSESYVIDDLSDFILSYIHSPAVDFHARRRGLLFVGTFRSNEVDRGFTTKVSSLIKAKEANATLITIDDFPKDDAEELVSLKLCMPRRYTRELVEVIHSKTRGNIFFALEFLRSIIRTKMLQYSVKYRQWTWDPDVVDMQMISDDVAQLLMTKFGHLPSDLQNTLRVLSCLGYQVEESTINALDAKTDAFSFSIRDALPMAITEGILESAGPIYQFAHDIIHQTIYQSIPTPSRILLHKTIGKKLIKSGSENSSIITLAADQINMFRKVGIPPDINERLLFAQINAKAAKIAIAASSFDQARTYVDLGIDLLDARHWQTQFSLSLKLFEMSASVSWAQGDLPKMTQPLAEILSNAKELDDKLVASSLFVMLFTASSKYDEAIKECCRVLEKLGESLPTEYDVPFVLNELSSLNESLENLSVTQMKQLPPMSDKNKLSAMKFLNLLGPCAAHSKPGLLHIVSCRMVKLTLLHGFCEDSIVGLCIIGLTIYQNTDNFGLASRIGKIAEALIEQSPKKHHLRSRMATELYSGVKPITEPVASVMQPLPDFYNSAMMVGDSHAAIMFLCQYHSMVFRIAAVDLPTSVKNFTLCIKEAIKYQQQPITYMVMATLNVCTFLSGVKTDTKILSLDELDEIGEKMSPLLLFHSFICRLMIHFLLDDCIQVVKLAQWYGTKDSSEPKNRAATIFRSIFEGIACFRLARDTKQLKWKAQGEKAMGYATRIEPMCKSNFENKVHLLRAELHYLEGDLKSAAASYEASITTARAQRFIHEEAIALELYGIFCVENQMPNKGIEQLRMALERYGKWGARKKAEDLQHMIDMVNRATRPVAAPALPR